MHFLQASYKLFYCLPIQLCIFHIGSLSKGMFLFKSLAKVK